MNVDLVLLKAELEKEIRNIAQREETLRSQLSNLDSVVSFLRENQQISEKCKAGWDGAGSRMVDPNGNPKLENRSSGIKVCPRCDVKVLPTKDGRCPSCQIQFSNR